MRQVSFDECRAEYVALWADCEIRPERARTVEQTARKIMGNRPRYDAVSRATGVPWFVIGIMHQMECNLSFAKHLHNGDPLGARTKLVPAGRPKVWPVENQDAWTASAIDALTMPGKEFHKVESWTLERIAYSLELYNGFGYRLYRGIHSPYLWSFTSNYSRGKYVTDGKWSKTAVSQQSGGMAILKKLMELDPLGVDLTPPDVEKAWPKPDESDRIAAAGAHPVGEAAKSRSVWALLTSGVLWVTEKVFGIVDPVAGAVETAFKAVPSISTEVDGVMTPLASLGEAFKLNIGSLSAVVAAGCIVIAIVRHSRDKAELVQRRNEQIKGD